MLLSKKVLLFVLGIVVGSLLIFFFTDQIHKQKKTPKNIGEEYELLLNLMSQSKYEDAILIGKRIINNNPYFHKAYKKIVSAAAIRGTINKTYTYFRGIREDYPENPYPYYGMGLILKEKGDFRRAIEQFKRTIELRPGFIPAYTAITDVFLKNKNSGIAETYFPGLIDSDSTNAAGYFALGYFFSKTRDWGKALRFLDKAIVINPDLWQAYLYKGSVYYSTSDYTDALVNWQTSLEIVRRRKDVESEGIILGRIGLARWNLDEYDQALNSLHRALEILREVGDKKNEGVVTGNTGLVYMYQWNYPEALNYFKKAAAINRETGYRIAEGMTLNNIGLIYLNSGNYRRALDYFERAREVLSGANYKRGEGIILGNFGAVYAETGYYQEALDYYRKALAIRRELKNKRDEGIILINMGIVYQRLGDYENAAVYLNDALTIYETTGQKVYQGILLNTLGRVFLGQGKFEQARNYHQQAFAVGNLLNFPRIIWEAQYGIGKTYHQQGQKEDALKYYLLSVENLESAWRRLGVDELKSAFLGDKTNVYHDLIRLLFESARQTPGGREQALAFHYAERTKARTFLDLLVESEIAITKGVEPELKEQEKLLKRKYDSVRVELQKESSNFRGSVNPDRIGNLKKQLKKIDNQWEDLKRLMKQRNPSYAQLKYPDPLTLEGVQRQLKGKNTVLLEYVVSDTIAFLWAVTENDMRMFTLPGEEVLREKINLLRRAVQERNLMVFFGQVSYDLYTDLLQPVEHFLKVFPNILIIPDGILNYLPFEMLVTTPPGKTGADHRYLVQDYSIRYVPSATVMTHLPAPDTSRWTKELLAFGDPLYTRAEQTDIFITDDGRVLTGSYSDTALYHFRVKRLPHTGDEIKKIGRLFPSDKVDLYFRDDANEEHIKMGEELRDYRRIHLATHGLLNQTKPQFSGLVLTLDDDPAEDGFLQAWEVFNLELNADMVVLSACRTAMGKLIRGEGIVGLSRAFIYAGTPTVVVSLWNVKDESTTELMTKFYRNLIVEKMTKAEALREAKLDMINSGKFRSPLYWAPFILIGES